MIIFISNIGKFWFNTINKINLQKWMLGNIKLNILYNVSQIIRPIYLV